MATAMLEEKVPPENFTVFCPGYAMFYGRMFQCHVFGKGGHGLVNLHQAIIHSCDVFFYNVGQRMGIDRISKYAKLLGLGSKTGIDLPSEEAGLVPSEEWVQRVYHRKWYPGETISVAIGQGAITVTPLQLARLVGGVASGGEFKQPHLLKDGQVAGLNPQGIGDGQAAPGSVPSPLSLLKSMHVDLSENTVEQVTQGLYGVVNEGGTAGAVKLEGIEFCGKTGTAQVIGGEAKERYGKGKDKFKNNAWFVGYAPRRNPEIVVSVLVEEGGHGNLASAPIARDIIKAYYDKKAKKGQGQCTVDYQRHEFGSSVRAEVAENRKAMAKPEQSAAVVPTDSASKPRPN